MPFHARRARGLQCLPASFSFLSRSESGASQVEGDERGSKGLCRKNLEAMSQGAGAYHGAFGKKLGLINTLGAPAPLPGTHWHRTPSALPPPRRRIRGESGSCPRRDGCADSRGSRTLLQSTSDFTGRQFGRGTIRGVGIGRLAWIMPLRSVAASPPSTAMRTVQRGVEHEFLEPENPDSAPRS